MSILLKNGFTTESRQLDRLPSPDMEHVEKYPLRSLPTDERPVAPMVMGINWYAAFDRPEQDSEGNWWIGRGKDLGPLRGGHLICATPYDRKEPKSWYIFYNQHGEGACTGFGISRMMSWLNRVRYDARYIYWEGQKIDIWPGGSFEGANPFYEGTDTRSVLEILRTVGHRQMRGGKSLAVSPKHGISAYRWATSMAEVHATLDDPLHITGYIPLRNSWGEGFPQVVRMPDETADRMRREDGEFGLVTDR